MWGTISLHTNTLLSLDLSQRFNRADRGVAQYLQFSFALADSGFTYPLPSVFTFIPLLCLLKKV